MIKKIAFTRLILYVSIFLIYCGTTAKLSSAQNNTNSLDSNVSEELPQKLEKIDKLVIELSQRKVFLYQKDKVVGNYPIAVGKKGWETPTGSFEVIQMIRNPSWQHPFKDLVIPPGADNPLGDRWIGFWTDGKNFIGFHGTPNEELVGQAVSHGCIRMRNQDIRNLFEIVTVGTPVIVKP